MELYTVVIGGVVHTVQLSAETAERLGAVPVKKVKPVARVKSKAPANKQAEKPNKKA